MNWLQKMMYGRNGGDHLSLFLSGVYVLLYLLSALPHLGFLTWVALLPVALAFFRIFSRNLSRRRAENARFLTIISPLTRWWHLHRARRRDKEHRYFKCPNCGQNLRVPRGKGRITITCRSCGVSFEEKS